MTGVLIRGNFRHRHTEKENTEEKKAWGECYEMVFEAEMGIRPPQAENHLGPPEARRGRREFFP